MASETSIVREGKVIVYPGQPEETVFDPTELKDPKVIAAFVAGFMQRVFREATAGKTENAEDRAKVVTRCNTRFAGWKNGIMEATRGEAVKLTPEEEANAIWSFIFGRKLAAGDKRSEAELRKAWKGLDDAKRAAVLEKHKKPIAKALRAALQAKRKPQETDF
jgi:predicted Fe-S protein YdhL (DUF1289 family)